MKRLKMVYRVKLDAKTAEELRQVVGMMRKPTTGAAWITKVVTAMLKERKKSIVK